MSLSEGSACFFLTEISNIFERFYASNLMKSKTHAHELAKDMEAYKASMRLGQSRPRPMKWIMKALPAI